MTIPVRILARARPTLASNQRIAPLPPDHPLAETDCPACGQLLGDSQPIVLVLVGIAPENQVAAGWTTAGAVAVHLRCAIPDMPGDTHNFADSID